ncbi:hypothetical protein BKP45_11450 [Anaerobacillus alkalidiazotrophicus]|uniref:Pyrroline-5-carboxylate reductase catalytic N-terminal domain-containing protein n=1 Tax=Anaerobacillus alkalidiazotrophicus TaxID=472963 RepID=A0A1S2M7K1_9BACI|nr:hypothetical protein [Anaerobacillus alkalidiazotrophicus]OIJ18196.1 hypothetical protein BKP45_17165 [Anaerobacillus alkalidiazotrophicus]OIJ19675.1 hypothetical protein BKP45_11450 [Anaerobacillus alkalidiazotrophicus]
MNLIVGLGKLAQSVLKLCSYKEEIFVYTRKKQKVEDFQKLDNRIVYLEPRNFNKVRHVLLMLPANNVIPFLNTYEKYFRDDVKIYLFATALHSNEVNKLFSKKIIPCKLAGHAKQMVEDQNGLFVVPIQEEIEPLRNFLGENFTIVNGTEKEVLLANTIGTKASIEMVLKLEEELIKSGVQPIVIRQTLSQITRGNVKAYLNNDLGDFAKNIVQQITLRGKEE